MGWTDGRTLDRFINPAPHTMHAARCQLSSDTAAQLHEKQQMKKLATGKRLEGSIAISALYLAINVPVLHHFQDITNLIFTGYVTACDL